MFFVDFSLRCVMIQLLWRVGIHVSPECSSKEAARLSFFFFFFKKRLAILPPSALHSVPMSIKRREGDFRTQQFTITPRFNAQFFASTKLLFLTSSINHLIIAAVFPTWRHLWTHSGSWGYHIHFCRLFAVRCCVGALSLTCCRSLPYCHGDHLNQPDSGSTWSLLNPAPRLTHNKRHRTLLTV